MGTNSDIEVTVLKFDASKPKAAIIVPQVHPGPFKNIGSSLLPSLMKKGYEHAFGGDACVPLGILGHELDLASQAQNNKIINQTVDSAKFKAQDTLASPLVRVKEGTATASCQIFGDTAFLSFSLAPNTTEDLPQELGRIVTEKAKTLGLKNALVVNTHNCLTAVFDTAEHLDELIAAASKCLQKAVALPTKPFRVGSATLFPTEFNLKAGMGAGGITSIVVEVENQKTAYIIIDGNNMIPGLRETILDILAGLGFDSSEVFTTDTHSVTASITGRRGYHPVGEVMDHKLLLNYIRGSERRQRQISKRQMRVHPFYRTSSQSYRRGTLKVSDHSCGQGNIKSKTNGVSHLWRRRFATYPAAFAFLDLNYLFLVFWAFFSVRCRRLGIL